MVASIEVQEITVTLKRLVELLESEDEDDYGILKPSDYAFKTIMNLVLEAHFLMGNSFPRASASTDYQGGIRLDWTSLQSDREVCLVCPFSPERAVYIYHQTSDDYAVEDDISPSILVKWLEWFNGA